MKQKHTPETARAAFQKPLDLYIEAARVGRGQGLWSPESASMVSTPWQLANGFIGTEHPFGLPELKSGHRIRSAVAPFSRSAAGIIDHLECFVTGRDPALQVSHTYKSPAEVWFYAQTVLEPLDLVLVELIGVPGFTLPSWYFPSGAFMFGICNQETASAAPFWPLTAVDAVAACRTAQADSWAAVASLAGGGEA